MPPRSAGRARYDRATARLDAPSAVVDLDAFDANAADLVRRAAGKPVRVASTSVRCRPLLDRVPARDGFSGTPAFGWPAAGSASDRSARRCAAPSNSPNLPGWWRAAQVSGWSG